MDSNSSNGNTDASVDNSQRDKNSSNSSDHYVPKSEPSASSTTIPTSSPASPTIVPLVTSPPNEQSLTSAPVLTSSPPPTLQTTSSSNSTANNSNNLTTTTVATHKTQAAFVNKLYTMVEDQSIQHLISWAPSGDVFSVSNPTEFSKTVLPQYFKHNNWQSFVRQLNMYGFHKVNDMFHANPTSESQAWEFKHPEFRRGQLAALQNIKRKSSKHQSIPMNSVKGGLSGADPGMGLPLDINADMRDERIECLTNQMSDITERMRQMNENFSLLYAETVSCRMQQSKHEKVITDIANFLSSTFREENSNDPRSLKRKFDLDCIQAEVAKFGQNDVPPSSYPMMQYHPSNYPREGIHQARSMSTPQPMTGVEPSSSYHHSQMSDVDYRPSSFQDSRSSKISSHSPLSMLPDIPFSHYRSSSSYIRHRSLEPVTNPGLNRTLSTDASYRSSKPPTNSHHPQSSSQYVHHSPHRSSTLPTLTQSVNSSNRRASHPNTSLSFGSDSNLLNPPENNRYEKDDDPSSKSQRVPLSSSPPSTSYTNSENPIVANSTTTRQRSPPLPDPPDNDVEYNNKRCKRN
ncbi:winged helix DNA-binding domain-containing protein [Gigaspora margarita]|uniref:Winged helix DNA-binding domain-containing protein n=2 Tax=Gigaspora margarita TaxID=4874 RepID=A0A8H4ACZ5_GIGMA|nr:winged helix DNA-binding domain-containing protein [Gigaspora margarita]